MDANNIRIRGGISVRPIKIAPQGRSQAQKPRLKSPIGLELFRNWSGNVVCRNFRVPIQGEFMANSDKNKNVDDIEDRLAKLPQLDKIELSKLWRKFFHRDPPDAMRKDLMVRVVGHRLQEEAFGGLSSASVRRLRELSKTFEANPEASLSSRPAIKPGTRLVRQWQQQVHVVDVEERGYAYKGVLYESLSEIARLITGTRWSGPLFFGLKERKGREDVQVEALQATKLSERQSLPVAK
jgi:hypothetical protein